MRSLCHTSARAPSSESSASTSGWPSTAGSTGWAGRRFAEAGGQLGHVGGVERLAAEEQHFVFEQRGPDGGDGGVVDPGFERHAADNGAENGSEWRNVDAHPVQATPTSLGSSAGRPGCRAVRLRQGRRGADHRRQDKQSSHLRAIRRAHRGKPVGQTGPGDSSRAGRRLRTGATRRHVVGRRVAGLARRGRRAVRRPARRCRVAAVEDLPVREVGRGAAPRVVLVAGSSAAAPRPGRDSQVAAEAPTARPSTASG